MSLGSAGGGDRAIRSHRPSRPWPHAAWLVLAGSLLILLLAGCGTSSNSASDTDVIYGASGSACSADITYQDLSGTQTTLKTQSLPWQFQFSVPPAQVNGFPLFLTALNDCATGSLTINAVVNGSLFSTQTTFAPNGFVEISVSLF